MDNPSLSPSLGKMGKKTQTVTWLIRCNIHMVIVVLSAVLVTMSLFKSIHSGKLLYSKRLNSKNNTSDHDVDPLSTLSSCDFFSGKWVYDNKSRPLYRDSSCEFMFDDLACEKFGRKDLDYQYWRWQPHDCDLPRFDSKLLLEKLKNKRIVFVGDSVNRNQWVSLVCMVESAIPKAFKYRRLNGSLYTFKATEYNATIDFYWAPLLVESNSDDPSNHRLPDRIVRVGAIEKHAKYWSDADILVFNSYLWWKVPKLKISVGSLGNTNQTYKEVGYIRCYKMALKTWSNWLDVHLNRTKTQVFFVSMAPTHKRAEDWGMSEGKTCVDESEPISRNGYRGSESDPKLMRIAEAAITGLKVKGVNIRMLNITQLSEYRKDGHPTLYRKQWHPLTQEQLSNPKSFADCTHWCLPGVPDVWNELLAAYLLYFQ